MASPERTSWLSWLKIDTDVLLLNTPLVARLLRPFLLFTKSVLAEASQVSRCHGSRTSPMPLPEALSALASLTIWGSVAGGSVGLRPALVKAFSL